MVKAFNKKESKRMTCHKKYKIRKKVREHNKKLAKTLKTAVTKKKKKGDGHVPNMAPFKEELLLEAVAQIDMKKEEKLKNKKKYPLVVTKPEKSEISKISSSTVSYQLTVSQCDVLLWVIDVRSGYECFCDEMFSEILKNDKTVIFVLNKIDLVPLAVLNRWYTFYSKKAQTFVIKSTQILLSDCEQIIPAVKQILSRFGGAKPLLNHLKTSYTEETKVGVIGGPKVGKSCVISTVLKFCGRTKAKKTTQTKLGDNLKLVTVPGLMNIEYKGVLNILVNLDRYMNVPAEVLSVLAASITKADAMYHFTLPEYDHPEGFVAALAVRYNIFYDKKPDHSGVGRLLLKQLRDHKLKFYVDCEESGSGELPAEITADMSKFIFTGQALKIDSSEINIVIKTREKKKKSNEMDVEEGVESDSGSDEDVECSDGDMDASDEEMA